MADRRPSNFGQDGQFIGFQDPGNGGLVPDPSTLLFRTGIAGLISRKRKLRS
jgi:hypothetical protein